MSLCPKNLTKFTTTTRSNEFLALADQQIIVTTCENANAERKKLTEEALYSKVLGLPDSHDCATAESFCEDDPYQCEDYSIWPEDCGLDDNEEFIASRDCCASCGVKYVDELCLNFEDITDSYGDTCESWYNFYPQDCGEYDDEDFKANEACCACGGGNSELQCHCEANGNNLELR